jgi:hypothetical protein
MMPFAALWAYMVYREIRHGQFRRKGEWGWFRRHDHPREFAFSLALDAGYLIVLVAVIAWALTGTQKP